MFLNMHQHTCNYCNATFANVNRLWVIEYGCCTRYTFRNFPVITSTYNIVQVSRLKISILMPNSFHRLGLRTMALQARVLSYHRGELTLLVPSIKRPKEIQPWEKMSGMFGKLMSISRAGEKKACWQWTVTRVRIMSLHVIQGHTHTHTHVNTTPLSWEPWPKWPRISENVGSYWWHRRCGCEPVPTPFKSFYQWKTPGTAFVPWPWHQQLWSLSDDWCSWHANTLQLTYK